MINFNLMKILFFLYFYEHKNIKLNNFIYISKGVNFRVLQHSTLNHHFSVIIPFFAKLVAAML